MSASQIFSLANSLALFGWLILILAGRRRWAASLVTGAILPAFFAALYIGLLSAHWGEAKGGFTTLEAVRSLFSNQWAVLGGWIHYLAFDLFIGSWQVRDSERNAIPHWMVIPCLILTFLLGPAGLLCYLLLRYVRVRRLALTSA